MGRHADHCLSGEACDGTLCRVPPGEAALAWEAGIAGRAAALQPTTGAEGPDEFFVDRRDAIVRVLREAADSDAQPAVIEVCEKAIEAALRPGHADIDECMDAVNAVAGEGLTPAGCFLSGLLFGAISALNQED